jgi:hypothetical protein
MVSATAVFLLMPDSVIVISDDCGDVSRAHKLRCFIWISAITYQVAEAIDLVKMAGLDI